MEAVLAHAHLRLGALALARVELETMAGIGLLDARGLVDLAEVRWRTGDLLGAGEAANAALRDDDGSPVALVIAAEAAVAVGRPNEARKLAGRVLVDRAIDIDAIFAGMPRSNVWPGDSAEPPPTAPTLFDREPELPMRADAAVPAGQERAATERLREASTATPVMIGFWDGEAGIEPAAMAAPDAAAELDAGRNALVAGALDDAALHFSLALRVAPALAPAVLEATDGARSASLTIVRGDAYRLAGHEGEARQSYAVAAQGGLPERRSRPRQRTPARTDPSEMLAFDADDGVEDGAAGVAGGEHLSPAAAGPDTAGAEVTDAAGEAVIAGTNGTTGAAGAAEASEPTGSAVLADPAAGTGTPGPA